MDWDKFLTQEIKEISQDVIDAENRLEYQAAKRSADQIIKNVHRFIAANPHWDARAITEKFGLDWALITDFGNGLGKIGFYTDISQRFLVMSLHLPLRGWFVTAA